MVMEEVDQVFGGDAERPCSTQDAAQLKYLECCIKETLRLYPSVPAVMRSLTEDIDIGNSIVENKNCVILDKPLLISNYICWSSQVDIHYPLASRWP